ncbi:DMT family transporter [Tellurirhabdus bombi]|uniref:DMT family transporter n=1 Tax=Tellurirhabdus bombi TaxID=2907205 RepID=UPI001F23FA6F|nr:EamA family transporter [Tellurirhabdus bombi]
MRSLLPGLLFALLWASASAATKFGVQSADPLILANTRFLIAGSLMGFYAYVLRKNPLPKGKEWKQLTLFAFLNTTVYLAAFVLAIKQVSAGIGSLSTATSPLFITLISAIWLKRPLRWFEFAGVALGLGGVTLATYPLLQGSFATVEGLLILLGGMVSVSVATVYYARCNFQLPNIVINGWQVGIGGILLLPFTVVFADWGAAHYDGRFWASVFWLIIPVSVVALQLWFHLVRQDAVRASFWMFLCPIFGFAYSSVLLNEPITWHTYAGTLLVLAGLYLGQLEKFRKRV